MLIKYLYHFIAAYQLYFDLFLHLLCKLVQTKRLGFDRSLTSLDYDRSKVELKRLGFDRAKLT